ncbi:unnamed protein product [Orchesella dallaii]|uniref:Uncharacterized protein n=1 Tax=Orchesella dallaii TaxID=48710 RepID=A0ABP1QSU3_9HEXA
MKRTRLHYAVEFSLYRKQNVHCEIFEHRHYHNVFTTYFNIERPYKFDSSNEKIKTALRWLKRNNRLFIDFLSNYETVYGYLISTYRLRPEERKIQISKGNFENMVGKDTEGLLIPADDVKIASSIKADNHKFGVQHTMQNILNKLRDIINVNYLDPNLEAKRWPH